MPYTLLLADDSVTIQRVIELTFADEDVTVVAVSDGDQAIERLEASPPDIVLADIGMPGKNGYEVAQYIRRSPKLAHIPVVLLTGAFEPVDQARANEAGCDGVLAKPFEPQLVIGRVKELLARARRGPEAPGPEVHLDGSDEKAFSLPPLPPLAAQRPMSPLVDPPIAATQTGPVPRSELNDYFDRLDAAFSTLSSNSPAPNSAPFTAMADPPGAAIDTDIDWFGSPAAEPPSSEPWDVPAPPADDAPVDLPLSYASPQPEIAEAEPVVEVVEVVEVVAIAAPDERLAPIEESAPVELEAAPVELEAAPVEPEAAPVEPETAPVESVTELAPLEPATEFAPLEPVVASASDVQIARFAFVTPAVPVAPALELPLPNPPPLPALADAFAALLAAEQGEAPSPATGTWPAASPPASAFVSDELIEDVTRRVLDRLSDTVVREAVADIASKVAERLIREEIARIKASIK